MALEMRVDTLPPPTPRHTGIAVRKSNGLLFNRHADPEVGVPCMLNQPVTKRLYVRSTGMKERPGPRTVVDVHDLLPQCCRVARGVLLNLHRGDPTRAN